MPKAKIPENISQQALVVFMQLQNPIDYDAPDGKPVDLILAVLVPENQCSIYIPLLSALTEKFTDKNFLKQLRSAKSADEILQVFEIAEHLEKGSFLEDVKNN